MANTFKILSPKLDLIFKLLFGTEGSDKFHHHFGLYDLESEVLLTDILEIHTLEIPKARKKFYDAEDTKILSADEKARQLYEARLKEQSDYNTR